MAGSISSNVKRGSAELAILSVLETGTFHGYDMAKRIEQQTDGVLKFDVASLYPLLYRLEKRGWVSAHWEQAANGRKRRYYKLTSEGKKRISPLRAQWQAFFGALGKLAGLTGTDADRDVPGGERA
jgi:PadR family transcriptional regulator, regulatory protein PadR